MSWLAPAEPIPVILAARRARLLAFAIDQVLALSAEWLSRILALSVVGVLAYVCLIGFAIVQIILVGTRGQTVGKMIVTIAIVDRIDRVPPGFVRAGLVRQLPLMLVTAFTPALTAVYLLVDGVPIFASTRRCLHDYVAGTIVVDAPAEDATRPFGSAQPPALT